MPRGMGKRKRKRGPEPTQTQVPSRDPLTHFNHDILHLIFAYLPSSDIVRCRRVSQIWKFIITEWIREFGLSSRFRESWYRNEARRTSGSWAENSFLLQARQFHLQRSGKPKSVRRFKNVFRMVAWGGYVAWQSDLDARRGDWYGTDRVYWQRTARNSDGSVGEVNTIRAGQLFRAGGHPVLIRGMGLNSDGVLLLHLHSVFDGDVHACERNVIYSPANKTVLWSGTFEKDRTGYWKSRVVPLLVGQRRFYCASLDEENNYYLSAYDLTTGRRLYQSSVTIDYQDVPNQETLPQFEATTTGIFRLFQASNGEELLFKSAEEDPSPLQRHLAVVRGMDGQSMQRITVSGYHLDNFLAHPIPDEAVLVMDIVARFPFPTLDEQTLLNQYRVIVLRRFHYEACGRFRSLPADILFASKEHTHHLPPSALAVQPFTMTSLVPSFHLTNTEWTLWSRPMIPTSEDRFRGLARAWLNHAFSPSPPELGQSFLLEDPVMLTLPPKRGRRAGEVGLELPSSAGSWEVQFIDSGRVLLKCNNLRYLLDFS